MIKRNKIKNFSKLNQNQKDLLEFLIGENSIFESLDTETDLKWFYQIRKGWPLDTNIFYPNTVISTNQKLPLFSGFVLEKQEIKPVSFFIDNNRVYDPICLKLQKKPQVYLGLEVYPHALYRWMTRPYKDELYFSPGEYYFDKKQKVP